MKILTNIVRLNRNLANALERKFPALKCPDRTRPQFRRTVERIVESAYVRGRKIKILEVGSVDRPFLAKSKSFDYHGLDIESVANANDLYDQFFVQSIEDSLNERYDLIISRMVIEHVPNNKKSWKTMYEALETNGSVVHIFPGSRHPFSLATRIVGNRIQRILISYLRPGAENTGYPAYYNLCTPRQLKKELLKIGFQDIRIEYSYSANDYFKFFFPAYLFIAAFNLTLTRLGVGSFASNLYVEAKKT